MNRPTLILIGIAFLAVLTAGCAAEHDPPPPITGPPTTATTVEPEPPGTPDPQSVDEAEAAAAYEHYFEVSSEVEQRLGAQGWQTDLLPLTSGEHRAVLVNLYTQLEAQGIRTTVPSELVSVTPTEYVPDPTGAGLQQVYFDVCVDATVIEEVFPDGTDTGSWGMRAIEKVMMQRQPDGNWTVSESATQEGSTC